jgi:hypothetical protein
MVNLLVKPNTEYHGWVVAVGVISSVIAGFVVLGQFQDMTGYTSKGVPLLVWILGFAITGWLAKKRS